MEIYRAIVGVTDDKTGNGDLLELTIAAKDGANAFRQAIRCATKLNGVLTMVIHSQNNVDRIIFNLQKERENEKPGRKNSWDIIPMETGAAAGTERDVSGTIEGTGSEHNKAGSGTTEDI